MMFIDTHTHIYDEQFQDDIEATLLRAEEAHVKQLLMPNCDLKTIAPMLNLSKSYPDQCFAMMGLHPCYVKEDYQKVLDEIYTYFSKETFVAVGEIGLDYYWDQSLKAAQQDAFRTQIDWALDLKLPIVIHTRDSIRDGIDIVKEKQNGALNGVFHCFSGSLEEAQEIIALGFKLGIGGVSTFKNSHLNNILKNIDLTHLVLETDAPYLAPVPFRGKRNESSYIPYIAQNLSKVYGVSEEEIARQTSTTAQALFKL